MRVSHLGKPLSERGHKEGCQCCVCKSKRGELSFVCLKGRVVSEATREKLRQINLGKQISSITRAKISAANKGRLVSAEIREKIRRAKLGHFVSEVTREKRRQAKLGTHPSLETRKKMSEAHKGHHPSPATREKNRQAQLGEKGSNWQGGISFEPYSTSWTENLREHIRQRDNHTCQICNKTQEEFQKKLDVHHIDYDKKNLDPGNLVSLCHSCHTKTSYNRKKWIDFFSNKD